MPAPPPYGVSSTVRCRSSVQSRRSCTRRSSRPPVARLADAATGRAGRGTRGRSRRRRCARSVVVSHGLLGDHQVRRVGREQAARRVEHHATAGHVDHRHDHASRTAPRCVRRRARADQHVLRRAGARARRPHRAPGRRRARRAARRAGGRTTRRPRRSASLRRRPARCPASPRPRSGRRSPRTSAAAVRLRPRARRTVQRAARGGLGEQHRPTPKRSLRVVGAHARRRPRRAGRGPADPARRQLHGGPHDRRGGHGERPGPQVSGTGPCGLVQRRSTSTTSTRTAPSVDERADDGAQRAWPCGRRGR